MTSQTLRMHNGHVSFQVENVGPIDRLLRFGAAALLIGQILLWWDDPAEQCLLVLLGLYPAFTGMMGWDPLYAMAGARTCGRARYSVCGRLSDQLRAAAAACSADALAEVFPFRSGGAKGEAANEPDQRDRAA